MSLRFKIFLVATVCMLNPKTCALELTANNANGSPVFVFEKSMPCTRPGLKFKLPAELVEGKFPLNGLGITMNLLNGKGEVTAYCGILSIGDQEHIGSDGYYYFAHGENATEGRPGISKEDKSLSIFEPTTGKILYTATAYGESQIPVIRAINPKALPGQSVPADPDAEFFEKFTYTVEGLGVYKKSRCVKLGYSILVAGKKAYVFVFTEPVVPN